VDKPHTARSKTLGLKCYIYRENNVFYTHLSPLSRIEVDYSSN